MITAPPLPAEPLSWSPEQSLLPQLIDYHTPQPSPRPKIPFLSDPFSPETDQTPCLPGTSVYYHRHLCMSGQAGVIINTYINM